MSKLLRANFSRLKKNKVFWLGIIIMSAMGILYPVIAYFDMKRYGSIYSLEERIFCYPIYIGVLQSVFCSLFLGTEYSDGTIRNKLMIGHSRIGIYLSNLIVCSAAGVLMCLVSLISGIGAGSLLLGFFKISIAEVILTIICTFIMTFAYSAVFTFIAMLVQSKAVSAVLAILLSFLLFFTAMSVYARLDEPETYSGYVYEEDAGEFAQEEMVNPRYLSGMKRQVYEFLLDFLPSGQGMQIAMLEVSCLWRLIMYDCILVFFTTVGGVLLFRRKDIK